MVEEKHRLFHVNLSGAEVLFADRVFGPNNYPHLSSEIVSAGLSRPTASEIAFFAYDVLLNPERGGDQAVRDSLRARVREAFDGGPSLMGFTGLLYSLDDFSIYIQDRPALTVNPAWEKREDQLRKMSDGDRKSARNDITQKVIYMDRSALAGRIEAEDPSCRLTTYNSETRDIEASSLRAHPLVRAVYRTEGAEKLADISRAFYGGRAKIIVPEMPKGAIRVPTIGVGSFAEDKGKLVLRFSAPETFKFYTFGMRD